MTVPARRAAPSRTRGAGIRAGICSAAVTVLVGALCIAVGTPAGASPSSAPGAPGSPSYFDQGRKDCLGTARNNTSKVWYTVADGVLSDVYEPTIDNTNVKTLQYVVTDGSTFTDLQTRDLTYTVIADDSGMQCTVVATSQAHGYQLTTTYLTDPARDSVLMHTRLTAAHGSKIDVRRLSVFARLDAHVNGNGGGGSDNGGADTGTVDASGVPVIGDASTVSQAANRDYAVGTYLALSSGAHGNASVGYADSASDGLTQLDATHALGPNYLSAPNGHIVATEQVSGPSLSHRDSDSRSPDFVLSLGFGRSQAAAVSTAAASLKADFGKASTQYRDGWSSYDRGLHKPPTRIAGSSAGNIASSYYLDANVLKASEDKTYPGAIVASLASPWGQAVTAGNLVGGKPVYFGSYREVFGRDLYEAVTGLIADGDLSTARAATRFLFEKQQLASGEIPRNSLVNGKSAPDTGGDQLDETAYPILMAQLTGIGGDNALWNKHIKPAADFLVAHGPSFGVERWEEQSGYSPSTIAAEIAGLTAASAIARQQHDVVDAQLYQAVADTFQRSIKSWTVTSTGPYSSSPYFIRLSKTGDPNANISYGLGNGGPGSVDQRAVVDGGFQELVRLGELSPADPVYRNSLAVLDKQIAVTTPTGTGYYRYGTSAAAGSADGYGDCYQPSQTSCPVPGAPWPPSNVGTGHLWPVLSGERAESAIATGQTGSAASQLDFMLKSASGVGLVPEQVWEDPNLAASPFGTAPTTASIGFVDGQAAGSASPLTWAQAQRLRLVTDLGTGRITDQPAVVANRYVRHAPPGTAPVTITAPASGSSVSGTSTTVTGTSTPGASIAIGVSDTDTGMAGASVSSVVGADGTFSATVPVGFGTNVITVAATAKDGSTGTAQVSVVGDLVGGSTVLDVTDPAGDDNGPGTYTYPTAADFTPGSFDITRFQVLTTTDTVYLRTTLRDLQPTFGNTIGAQLLDIYVHTPTGGSSTAAAYPSFNYSIAPADAWSQRLQVQGFAAPIWVNASGDGVGPAPAVVSSTLTKTITIAVPAAQFGTPTTGWSFAVSLTGQEGSAPDQARSWTPTAGPYTFGVCSATATSPICAVNPATVPKAMDVITPAGVNQSTELDPTVGPVVLRAVPVP
ncbi:MAG TPA: glucodextranase DOMON-like domain-containing protein [Jatrophihabitans sp.]